MNSFIPDVFGDEFSFKIDDAIFEGNGAGMPLGFIKSGALVTINPEGGQSADTVIVENIVKMWARLWLRSRKTAIWTINQQIEPQLMTMKIGNQPTTVCVRKYGYSVSKILYRERVIAISSGSTLAPKPQLGNSCLRGSASN